MSEFPADTEESAEPGESEEAGESEVQPLSSAATMIPTEVRARVIREWGRLRFIIELLDTGAIHVRSRGSLWTSLVHLRRYHDANMRETIPGHRRRMLCPSI